MVPVFAIVVRIRATDHRQQARTRRRRHHQPRRRARLGCICQPRIARTPLGEGPVQQHKPATSPQQTSKYEAALARSAAMVAASDAAGAVCRSDSMSHTGGGVQGAADAPSSTGGESGPAHNPPFLVVRRVIV